ncbi:NAD(+) diphosphatase [Prosthecodimorpha staleyi]|uniref:NAD(+) diphosphatase n=1 Tax=Prosthecodimorpha staleyi TaxID=2840188 RepID=A0A947D4P7_9HYPH|nr:NAD(+) diphosphatase [Prosthecodimorpha staleyi]MBT9290725.1 NAD(+) diphosphatase [Prosthecodimorpha staleyi]
MPFPFFADEPSARVGFAGNRLDRLSEKRGDADWFARQLAVPDARFVLYSGDRPVVSLRDPGRLTAAHDRVVADRLGADLAAPVLLGFDSGADIATDLPGATPWFAAETRLPPEAIEAEGREGGPFKLIDLRSLALQGALPAHEMGAIAQARSLLGWHESHRFCSRCGQPSRPAAAGYRRDCPACGAQHFPRTDPVAIMMVTDGENCLLGRQARFAPGMYSCLAGFIEPGETIEAAVRRETWEEAGIEVGRVTYHASQPWPMVSTLMIGCLAEAVTTEIRRDEEELEDCRWFSRAETRAMLDRTHPDGLFAANPYAIAWHLVRAWAGA